MPITCAYHPDREPVGNCVACGRFICADCKALLADKLYCTACANKIFVQNQPGAAKPPDPVAPPPPPSFTPPAYVPPVYTPPAYTPPAYSPPASSTLSPSNSSSVNINLTQTVPVTHAAAAAEGAPRGWNWGAFMLTWIWGIAHSVWISFLVLVPVLNIIWPFVLGAKGNQWAWEKKHYDSVEQFKKSQKPWNIAGVILFVLGLVGGLIWLIVFIVAMAGIASIGFDSGF